VYTRFLVPLDGSHLAEAVLPSVERLAAACSARVVLLHILERHARPEVHGQPHLTSASDANVYLAQVADRMRSEGIEVDTHTHDAPEGDVARSIVQHAEEAGADLIVLCTHGGGRMREFLFGSIAQQVLNRGTVPVLLVRPAEDGNAPSFDPRVVLVPLDATADAEAALGPAAEIARRLGAALHLVMVVGTQETSPTAAMLPTATRAALDWAEEDASTYLEGLSDSLRSAGLSVTTEVRRGRPTNALTEEAKEPGVGLVVVATHGRAGLQAVWTGSVVARILRRTRGPILLLRSVEE
jgi:nucleotide-binding universal stress UspA family protein